MRNLQYLHELAQLPPQAQWLWLTPDARRRAARFPVSALQERRACVVQNRDIKEVSAGLLGLDGRYIDTSPAFSGDDAHLDDGIHPTLETQKRLAALVLAHLTR